MWFKYFKKSAWRLRLHKTYNLKFKANELSQTKFLYHNYFKMFMFKIFGHEAPLRIFLVASTFSALGIYSYYSELYYGDERRAAKKLKDE